MLAPEQLLGIEEHCENLGVGEANGRRVRHLRGRKEDLVAVCGTSTSLDFSRVDSAVIDLWVDEKERFIVKFHVTGAAKMGGGLLPFVFDYQHLDFNAPIAIEPPPLEELHVVEAPPPLTQQDVTRTLGFEFPVPEGAHVSIYGKTVVLVTGMPLDAAREYAAAAMRETGFVGGDEAESATGEFRIDYRKGERSLGVQVFQVSERGATIRVGAVK